MADLSRGDFNKRVTFRTVEKTENDSGGNDEVYSDLLTTWAKVESKNQSRSLIEGYDTVVDRKTIYVYHRTALDVIDKDTRILYNGKEYSIDSKNLVEEIKEIIRFEVSGVS